MGKFGEIHARLRKIVWDRQIGGAEGSERAALQVSIDNGFVRG